MITSQPILMINDNKQINAIKLHVNYQYKTAGVHKQSPDTGAGEILSTQINVCGIDKNGKTTIASCPLNTIAGYEAMGIASEVVLGIPVKDYAYVCYEYSPTDDFVRIIGQVNMFVEIREYPDTVDLANSHTLATLV